MKRSLLLLTVITLCSCKKILQLTIGKHYINTIHNTGTVTSENFYTSIPFKKVDNQIYLSISGRDTSKRFAFLFDTGAFSGISEEIVEEFDGFYNGHSFFTKDINDSTSSPQLTYTLDRLSLGNLDILNPNFIVTNYEDDDLNGIIGSNLLEGKIFIFNPNKKEVIITNDESAIDKNELQSFKIKKRWYQRYFVKLKTYDHKRWYMLDTGFDGFLTVDKPFEGDHIEILKQKSMSIPIMGAYSIGVQEITMTQMKDFNLNGISVDTANVEISNSVRSLIGSEIFHHGITILDFINNRIFLDKDLTIQFIGQPPYKRDVYFGSYEGNTVVAMVDLSLDSINIRPLDIVIEVNEMPILSKEQNPEDVFKQALKEGINHFILKRDTVFIDIYLDRNRIGNFKEEKKDSSL